MPTKLSAYTASVILQLLGAPLVIAEDHYGDGRPRIAPGQPLASSFIDMAEGAVAYKSGPPARIGASILAPDDRR